MAEWNDRAKTKYVGQRVARVEGPLKVSGRAKYTYDIQLPNMLYGVILGSPHAAAQVKSVDTSEAERMPGVKALHVVAGPGANLRHQGQDVAAVAAATEQQARDALQAIRVEYEVRPHRVTTRAASVDPERMEPFPALSNEAQDALQQADTTIEGSYSVPVRLHTCLETHGCVVRWDGDDRFTIWCSTQAVHGVRGGMAQNQGVPAGNVRVICEHMGGGFGSKLGPGTEFAICAALAKKAKAPVKLMRDRQTEQLTTGNGPDAHAMVRAGAQKDGKLSVIAAECFGTTGYSAQWGMPFPYVYRPETRVVTQRAVRTNCGSDAPLRAPMHPQGCAITEQVVDELAYALGMDPLAMRLANTDGVRKQQFELGAKLFGWEKRNPNPGADGGRFRRGTGVGTSTWGGGGGPGSRVELTIHRDATVEVKLGTQDLGTGTRTYVASIVAEDLGIDISRVRARIGDSDFGYSGASGGSTTTASVAPAVKTASLEARRQLFEKAADLIGHPADALDTRDGKVFVAADPSKSITFEEVCSRLGVGGIVANGTFDASLQQGGVAGVQFAEVEVDMWTGRVRPIRVLAVHDCGYWMNRLTTESQIIGGVIQGLGMALLEERKMDENTGRCLNPDLKQYKLPGPWEMPEIVPYLFETHQKVAGIGEPPVIPTAGAIANAVFHASGLRIRHLPITPRKLLEAMDERV